MGQAVTDIELLEASRRGERAAFGRLVERYQSLVCAVSYGATGDRALSEDVAQDTFITAWRGLDTLRDPQRLRSWLCGIARNLGRKAGRRSRREPAIDVDPIAQADSPYEQTASAETEQLVWDALQRIPQSYREALILYYREGQSAKEVGSALGITENAAMQRLSRGRKQLADNVTRSVESCLGRTRPSRGFAATVVGALPTRSSPHVTTTNPHGETSMIKLALIAGAVAVAGTAAFAIHHASADDDHTVVVAEKTTVEAAVLAPVAQQPAASKHRVRRPTPPALPKSPVLAAPSMSERLESKPRIGTEQIERLSLHKGPSRGPENAPVTIVVFGDFMCEFCGVVLGTVDEIWDDYPGQLKLVVKQFPVHEEAKLAAEAAIAAETQGKFWQLHDLMYANQDDLTRDDILGYAAQAKMDVDQLRQDLDAHTYRDAVAQDMSTAQELEIKGTPTFMVNGKYFVGARPVGEFREMIKAELERAAE